MKTKEHLEGTWRKGWRSEGRDVNAARHWTFNGVTLQSFHSVEAPPMFSPTAQMAGGGLTWACPRRVAFWLSPPSATGCSRRAADAELEAASSSSSSLLDISSSYSSFDFLLAEEVKRLIWKGGGKTQPHVLMHQGQSRITQDLELIPNDGALRQNDGLHYNPVGKRLAR